MYSLCLNCKNEVDHIRKIDEKEGTYQIPVFLSQHNFAIPIELLGAVPYFMLSDDDLFLGLFLIQASPLFDFNRNSLTD